MKVADLFIKLGLDGQNDVSKGLGKVASSLKELFSMSIQTKLTLAGIVSGLTAAAIGAGKTGVGLQKFRGEYNLSTQELQKFQWALGQVNVSAEETQSWIQGLADVIAEVRTNKSFDPALGRMFVGMDWKKANAFDLAKAMIPKIQSGNTEWTRMFGDRLAPGNILGAVKGNPNFNLEKAFSSIPKNWIYTDKQIAAQAKIQRDFDMFGKTLKKDMDAFVVDNAKLIKDVMGLLLVTLREGLQLIRDMANTFGYGKKNDEKKVTEEGIKKMHEQAEDSSKVWGGKWNPQWISAVIGDKILGILDVKKPDSYNGFREKAGIFGDMKPYFDQEKMSEPYNPMYEIQQSKNTSIFYMNGKDFTDSLKESTKEDVSINAQKVITQKQVSTAYRSANVGRGQ